MLLALDLSTRTGFCVGRASDTPKHGVWELGKDGNHGRYFSCLAAQLEAAIQVFKPDLVVMEAPLPHQAEKVQRNHPGTVRVLLGLAAVTEMICHEQAVKCEEADVRDARQMVLGRQPKDGKIGVMTWCRSMGWNPQDDNAADSLLLWEYRQCLARRAELVARGR